ncbi:hypothetical protein BD626DRAFT_571241 [Schizophyllum amplum]|uniref:Uncharacterized protein n=1 Tax=Schizophyllum amplum TaxID=97359 RepID=A0A550C7T6_9AGAR|nr:hypothetical protein BD626DRAFT_571241 [Auriculariopsis ampla]
MSEDQPKKKILTIAGLQSEYESAPHHRRVVGPRIRSTVINWLEKANKARETTDDNNRHILDGRDSSDEIEDGINTEDILCRKCERVNYLPCSLNCGHVACCFCVIQDLLHFAGSRAERPDTLYCSPVAWLRSAANCT